jgi:NAD(P)-dependent dehydrogenase (short-subunit alcohol dehydrogenase family)
MRTTLVTGAASGIGRALKEVLQARGETVISADRTDADIVADLSTAEGRSELVARAHRLSGGRLDAVAAVAGSAAPVPRTAAVNYFGAIATVEGLRPLLEGSAAPRAAVTASLAAISPVDAELLAALESGDETRALAAATRTAEAQDRTSNPIYNASKHALARWVRTHAVTPEWTEPGIALNAIAPGLVLTPMTEPILAIPEGRALLEGGAPAPLNGPAPARAPAELLAWLLSPANTHVTGQVIFIDGGAEALQRPGTV